MARTDLTGSATPSATGSQTRQGLIARLPTGSKSRSGMTVSPLDLRNSAGRSRRNNDSPTPRSPSIPLGNIYKPDRALATQFTISKSNDQPARRALVLGPLDSRSPFEGVLPGAPLFSPWLQAAGGPDQAGHGPLRDHGQDRLHFFDPSPAQPNASPWLNRGSHFPAQAAAVGPGARGPGSLRGCAVACLVNRGCCKCPYTLT